MTSFWDVNIGHLIELGAFAVAYVAYRRDRRNDAEGREQAREKMIETQTTMHTENKNKLETLTRFHSEQQLLNIKRDEQVSQLCTQTATLAQMAAGFDRRLQMLENQR